MILKKWMWIWGLAFGIAALGFGCAGKKEAAQKPEPPRKIVAKVNGTPITEEDLKYRIPTAHGKAIGNQERALDEVIIEQLLYEEGLKIGLDKDPGYQAVIARMERQLAHVKRAEMTRRVYNTQVAAKIEVTHSEVKDYYDRNVDRITTELHLGVIAFNNRETAEESLGKIRGGATFESVARAAMGTRGAAGREPWDLGFVSWDRVPVDFGEAVYQLKPGDVSNVVSSPRTGYQIFKLFEARKNSKAEFASVSGMIMNRLREAKMNEAYERYLQQLKKEAKIEKF